MRVVNMSKIYLYRYEMSYWEESEGVAYTVTGFVAGLTYGDAMSRLEDITTNPGEDSSTIMEVKLSEVDAYDGKGVLEDSVVTEVYKVEDNN